MSDGGTLLEDAGGTDSQLKSSGRARICKECRFTTTDAREFSNHRLHAHSEEPTPEKPVGRRTSLKAVKKLPLSPSGHNPDSQTLKKLIPLKKDWNEPVLGQFYRKRKSSKTTKVDVNVNDDIEDSLDSSFEVNGIAEKDSMTLSSLEDTDKYSENLDCKETKSDSVTGNDSEKVNLDEIDGDTVDSLASMDNSSSPPPLRTPSEVSAMDKMEQEDMDYYKDDDPEEPRLVIAEAEDNGDGFDEQMDFQNEPPALTRSGNIQNRTYICGVCDFSTTSAKTHLHHMKELHGQDIIIYECDICEYATKYKQKLPRHRKLHFSGKDSALSGSDLESSFTEKELKEMKEGTCSTPSEQQNGDEEEEDEAEEEEEEEVPVTESVVNTPTGGEAPVVKKKRIRQEVDPAKYFEVFDDVGIKYACSKCGNIYKWRKSLNKHWKEKHFGETPDASNPPPALQNYTIMPHFRQRYSAHSNSPSNYNQHNGHQQSMNSFGTKTTEPSSSVVMPKFIGPFIAGVSTPVQQTFPTKKTPTMPMLKDHRLDSRRQIELNDNYQMNFAQRKILPKENRASPSQQSQKSGNSQMEPLDFSVKKELIEIKAEPFWAEDMDSADSYQSAGYVSMVPQSSATVSLPMSLPSGTTPQQLAIAQMNGGETDPSKLNPVLQCNKCAFVAKTLVDYSSHMTLHLNKRAFKCAECNEHFNGVDDLNKHFADFHVEKIQEHKEAIQKIPHGLQQTYHLLKMPLDAISGLSSQELLSNEPKQLNCSMCSFVAKWPAELQKHAVSHSEERPFVCMVCGSTYKWKWDLVKHFEKSHNTLPNPYKRREGERPIPVKSSIEKLTSPMLSPALAPASGSAVVLLDDNFTHRLQGGEENRKKRRLSDTDVALSDENRAQFPRLQSFEKVQNSNTGSSSATNMEVPTRPSSEPSTVITNGEDEVFNEETAMDKDAEISEKALYDEARLEAYDEMHAINRPVNEHTQKVIADAIKQRIASGNKLPTTSKDQQSDSAYSDILLPYKCSICEYRARWPSEITQHMKNHSNEKPYHCPRCSYKSKWKWDVVKHLRRCGGGTVNDVIDMTKVNKGMAPPNVMVMPHGNLQQQTPQPSSAAPQYFINQMANTGGRVGTNLPTNIGIKPGMSDLAVSPHTSPNVNRVMNATASSKQPESLDLTMDPTMDSPSDLSGQNPAGGAGQKQQPVFRSLINQGMYHCLECPFVGNSTAELRRHTFVHSENKPFVCNTCGYSSRWKCDLKKHMKTYGHYNSQDGTDGEVFGAPTSLEEKFRLEKAAEAEEEKTLYMCRKCPYSTYNKSAYEVHLKIHGDVFEGETDQDQENASGHAKFKCSKCEYQGNDLSSFLQHKVSHANQQNQSQESERSSVEVSSRTLHLKHRRKPVQQFRCPKCPYVCFKRSGLSLHESMHEPRGADAFLCLYCDYNVFSKSLLLQHMRLHPEYNPSECTDLGTVGENELMEIEEMEEKDAAVGDKDDCITEVNNNVEDSGSQFGMSAAPLDFSRSSTPSGFSVSRSSTPAQYGGSNKDSQGLPDTPTDNSSKTGYPCEWCNSMFQNVALLYQHAKNLHPLELKAQESGDAPSQAFGLKQLPASSDYSRDFQYLKQLPVSFAGPQQNRTIASFSAFSVANSTPNPPPAHTASREFFLDPKDDDTREPIAAAHSNQEITPYSIFAARAKKTISPQKRARSFQCTRCSFTAPNAVTYLRHIERHGSNCKHTCSYCDYSIDRLNLLYQHMKGTHGKLWKGTAQEKISLSTGLEDSNNNLMSSAQPSPSSVNMSDNSDELNASFGSYTESNDGENQEVDGLPIMLSQRGVKPVLVIRETIQWRGIPVQVCSLDGKKHYKCPKCYYISSNAANTTNHVRQHGSNRRYKCHRCDYSVDSLKLIDHHMETVHPSEPFFNQMSSGDAPASRADEFISEVNNNELSLYGNKYQETVFPEIKSSRVIAPSQDTRPKNYIPCPKCPFRARWRDILQRHMERHEYKGKYVCKYCDYSVDRYNLMLQHERIHTPTTQAGSNVRPITETTTKDKQMEGSATELRQLLTKTRLDQSRLHFKCSICPFSTYSKKDILKHGKQHIIKSDYPCHKCSFSTSRAFLLHQHMKCHGIKHLTELSKANNAQQIVVDPYDGKNAQVLKSLPGDDEADAEEEMDDLEEEMSEEMTEMREMYGDFEDDMGEVEEEDGEMEDDIEARLMEEELRQSSINTENLNSPVDLATGRRNMNEDSAFDSDIQFRNYKCQNCPYSSNSASEYRKHCRLHGANFKFKCDYCDYSLDRVNLLSQHRKLHFQEPDFDPAPQTRKLLNHSYIDPVTGIKGTPQIVESTSKLDEKVREYRYMYPRPALPSTGNSPTFSPADLDEKIRYSCNRCPYKCNALKSFKCHIQMHGLKRKYICDYCNWSADRLNLLYQHRRVHVNETGYNPNPGDIAFLNREFALDGDTDSAEPGVTATVGMALQQYSESPFNNEELQKYQQSPDVKGLNLKTFCCKLCPFQSSSINDYTYHKNLHRIEARYPCSECSFSSNSWNTLSDHMKLHKKENMAKSKNQTGSENRQRLRCPKCPYSSPNKNLLEVHVTMHASGRKFTCEYCDYSIDRYNLLQQHMKIHLTTDIMEPTDKGNLDLQTTPKKPSVITPQLYLSPAKDIGLEESDSNHSNEPELKCEQCPYSTVSKEELETHELQHELKDKNSCPYCTYSCSSNDELLAHIQVHFPSSRVNPDMLKVNKDQASRGKRNISKSLEESSKPSAKRTKVKEEESGEPDSTVEENVKAEEAGEKDAEETSVEQDQETEKGEENTSKTKIYVCQYCEREFESKPLMLQHEKQHLIGYQY